ncbi:hypothetical protein NB714_004644 [Pantoea dispersa]|nr:hypothetical protein [Pantoea dispersa]MCW0328519.1 hypothetical protein [Pantoea dispersa]MCW0434944.1 hypothetical protein [Pantoea dispersa]
MNLIIRDVLTGLDADRLKCRNYQEAAFIASLYDGERETAEDERLYWQGREKAALRAPAEIDVHRFHDALGVAYPLNWSCSEDGECETFMLAEFYCGQVTDIYARTGVRYFRLRDYSNLDHAQIMTRVKEAFDLSQK